MNRNTFESAKLRVKHNLASLRNRAAAFGTTAMVLSGTAFAGGSGPGDAIAGELAGGKAQQMIVIGAVAVMLGVLIVWALIKRAK